MLKELYTIGGYSIKDLSETRLVVLYDKEMVCKYDKTKEGIKELIDDLVDFIIKDKIIKRTDEKIQKLAIIKAVA